MTRLLEWRLNKQRPRNTHHLHDVGLMTTICKGLSDIFTLSLLISVIDATFMVSAVYASCRQTSRANQIRRGNARSFYPGPVPDHVLVGRGYRNVTTHWSVTCASYCLQDDSCKSFNFCHTNRRCELNSAVYANDKSDLYPSNGCEYYDERFHTECNVRETIGDYEPSFFISKLQPDEIYTLDFAVKGVTDAIVWLSEEENRDKHYEIIIIGWSNTRSKIRTERGKTIMETYVDVAKPGLMNASEYRRFWITFYNWEIKVGIGGQDTPYMEWNDTDHRVTVNYIGITSNSGRHVEWIFYSYCN